jgi:hypothetical protein
MEVLRSLAYSFHLIFHPFDGFWDLKHEKRGSLKAANVILVLLMITYILRRQFTGFLFNLNDLTKLNIYVEILSVLVPFGLWCVANWCLTTLMDGEGSMKDIWITTAYALVPIILINLPLILLSNVITIEEEAFYKFFAILSLVWSGGLLLFGTMTVHQYSFTKTVITCIAILVGMGVMIFIALLFLHLIQVILSFAVSIYREITFRM